MCPCGCDDTSDRRPAEPRVWVYLDAQNLFRTAGRCFNDRDVPYLNYDPLALAQWAANQVPRSKLLGVTLYTGIPNGRIDDGEADLEDFWRAKLSYYGAALPRLFHSYTRPLRYNYLRKFVRGRELLLPKGEEKGIDVRLGLDLVLGALQSFYDVGVVFSQDKDLNEATKRIRRLRDTGDIPAYLHMECVYAVPDTKTIISRRGNQKIDRHGISNARWRALPRDVYLACRDKKDFRNPYRTGHVLKFAGNFEVTDHVTAGPCVQNDRSRLLAECPCPPCPVCGGDVLWRRYKQFR